MLKRSNSILIQSAKFLIFAAVFLGSSCSGLSLKESVDSALQNNPEILIQTERIKALEGKVNQSFSEYLPKLNFDAEYGKDYRTPVSYSILGTNFVLYPDEAANVINYGANISQNLFTGGKLTANFNIAKVNLEIAKEELSRKRQELAYGVASAYFNLLRAKRMLDLSLESIDFTEVNLKQVRNYYGFGKVRKGDLLQAEIGVAEAELNKISAEQEMESSKISFNMLLGKKHGEPITLEETEFNSQETSLPGYEELLALALAKRPEWKILNYRKRIGEEEISLAKSEFYPNLSLNGSASKNISDYPNNSLKRDINFWNIYAMFSWNVFNGLKTSNRVKEARANLSGIVVNEEQIKNQIAAEVKEAQLYFDATRLRIRKARTEVELAGENLELAKQEYREGVGRNVDLLEAQAKLTKARLDLFQAQSDFAIAKAKINLAEAEELLKL